MPEQFDVIVIGGGTAGLVTASGCVRLGRKVALIERARLGGDCLWTGCVPTKALVASAKLAHQMRNASAFGLDPVQPQISPRAVMDSMRSVRKEISRHDDPEKFRKLGIDVIEGEARFLRRDSIAVGDRTLAAKDIVIATGARTSVPPVEGLDAAGFLDHATFLDRDDFPNSIVILGGGYIGIEFAQMFRRFGCSVTVVEMLDEIINKEDSDVIARIRGILSDEGIEIRTSWSAKSVRQLAGRKVVSIEGPGGTREDLSTDEVFVASGRRGNTDGLGLETLGMTMNRSFIAVNEFLETSVARVWACGDVHGGMQFTHAAAFEAVKLVRNMLFPGKSKVRYDHIPWALYTDPEVGHIGMTEHEARLAIGEEVRVYATEMTDVDRAVVDRASAGFVKFVCDRKGTILGAHVVCANASTLIEEIVLARKKGVKIGELAQLVSPYPSLADSIQKAAALYYQNLSTSWIGAVGRRVAKWAQ